MTQIIQIETAASVNNATMLSGEESSYKCEIGLAETVEEAVERYCAQNSLVIITQTGDGADNTKHSYLAKRADNGLDCPNFFVPGELIIYACPLKQSF